MTLATFCVILNLFEILFIADKQQSHSKSERFKKHISGSESSPGPQGEALNMAVLPDRHSGARGGFWADRRAGSSLRRPPGEAGWINSSLRTSCSLRGHQGNVGRREKMERLYSALKGLLLVCTLDFPMNKYCTAEMIHSNPFFLSIKEQTNAPLRLKPQTHLIGKKSAFKMNAAHTEPINRSWDPHNAVLWTLFVAVQRMKYTWKCDISDLRYTCASEHRRPLPTCRDSTQTVMTCLHLAGLPLGIFIREMDPHVGGYK